ncbi:MAG: hypothetical protein IT427_01795 [Pirellulales bacterium]|nr:hypothetical protein [Pirellulales bacterium]
MWLRTRLRLRTSLRLRTELRRLLPALLWSSLPSVWLVAPLLQACLLL